MKKLILSLLAFVAAGSVFSAENRPDFVLSAGGGGIIGYTFTRYTLEGTASGGSPISSRQSMDRFNYGGGLFFDAVYAEFSVLFQWGESKYAETMGLGSSGQSLSSGTGSGTERMLGFSLAGKYPFVINNRVSVFPLLGVEYQIAMVEWRKPDSGDIIYDRSKGKLPEDRDKDNNPYPLLAWNSFWIDVGGGIDYSFAGPLYVRGELLFNFRLPTIYEMGALDMLKKQFNASDLKLGGLTGEPAIKILVGYKFQ